MVERPKFNVVWDLCSAKKPLFSPFYYIILDLAPLAFKLNCSKLKKLECVSID